MIIGVRADAVNINGAYDLNDPMRIAIRNRIAAHLSNVNDDDSICISRASMGFEIDFIYACHENEIPYIVYLPFEKIEDRWPPQIQKIYKDILRLSKNKFIKNKGGYSPKKIKTTQDFIEKTADAVMILNRNIKDLNSIDVKMLKFDKSDSPIRT